MRFIWTEPRGSLKHHRFWHAGDAPHSADGGTGQWMKECGEQKQDGERRAEFQTLRVSLSTSGLLGSWEDSCPPHTDSGAPDTKPKAGRLLSQAGPPTAPLPHTALLSVTHLHFHLHFTSSPRLLRTPVSLGRRSLLGEPGAELQSDSSFSLA